VRVLELPMSDRRASAQQARGRKILFFRCRISLDPEAIRRRKILTFSTLIQEMSPTLPVFLKLKSDHVE